MKKKVIIPILVLMLLISGIGFISHSATFISTSQKEVIRDSKRLNDLTVLRKAIEDYKTKNGYYPKLESGTNIKGYVNSVWSSQWTSFCNLVGLSSCPIDPINEIANCDCKVFSTDGKCSGDNINSNIDTTSCYNSKAQSFACTAGSNFYQYQSLNNGRNYSLMMEFEYVNNVNWGVTSTSPDNFISIKDNCVLGDKFYKVYSNRLPKCGDGVLNYSEICEVGSKKTEYCKTADNKTGIRYVNCSSSCVWDTANVGNCLTVGFCGDGIIQSNKGEECDGGYQKMCYSYQDYSNKNIDDKFANNSHYDWYNEQLRYCGLNCKWNSNFIDSTFYCGGFCGDGIVQEDRGEECDNSSDAHCGIDSCKYQNSAPVFEFDFYKDRSSNKSYIKSHVFSGDKFQYENNYYGNNDSLVIADKKSNDYVAIWNSDFIEIKVGVTDKEGDGLLYKYNFPVSYNLNFKLKYAKSSDASKTFHDYVKDSFVDGDILRMYPTKVNKGKNTYKNFTTNDADLIFGENYVGYYTMNVVIKESYNKGNNSTINPQGFTASQNIDFKIGPGCGDRILQKDLGETCEWRPNVIVNDFFLDWGSFLDSTNTRYKQPDGGGNCVTQVFTNNIGLYTFYNPGKIDDVSCSANSFYGICEKRVGAGCDDSWVKGVEDNCYKLTSKAETWQEAYNECVSYNSHLVVYSDISESNFIKNKSIFNSKEVVWIGVYKEGGYWKEVTGAKTTGTNLKIGSGFFSDSIFDGGFGSDLADEYYCGLPGDFDACIDNRGYCGDNVANNLFEECDETDKSSYGSGVDKKNQYECKKADTTCSNTQQSSYSKEALYSCSFVNNLQNNPTQYSCRDSGGYCGDGFFQSIYEHCDPKTRITAADSNLKTFGVNNFNHQYICTTASGYDLSYKDVNDFNTNKNSDTTEPCRKSFGGFCGDGSIQSFYSFDGSGNYVINSSSIFSQNSFDWKNIAYDGVVNKHYFINGKSLEYLKGAPKDYFTSNEESMLIEECDPTNYTPVSILPKESLEGVQYGGCGANDNTSNPCIMEFYTTGTLKGVLKSHSGNCACRKIQGGYCGNGNLESDFLEECDPELADYDSAKLTSGSKSTILQNSSSSKQYFCGATAKYSENIADLNKYDSSGAIIKTFVNTNQSDLSCRIFGGYCGDGIVQSDYTNRILQSNQSYFYSHNSTLEQCDPKNHQVLTKDSSSYNSYNCGSISTPYACLNLNNFQKDSSGKYGGYCGDGKIQYDLTVSSDSQGGSNEISQVDVDVDHPEQCDPSGRYVINSSSSNYNQYDCGVTPNSNACKDISGYCGNAVVDSYYNWAVYSGSSKEPNGGTAENCVVLNGKNDGNIGEWIDIPCSYSLNFVCEQENPTNSSCINGFIKWSNGNNNCYAVSSVKKSYDQIACVSGSHKVIINSQRENDFVENLVSSINDWAYIGLNDVDRENEFVWSDNFGLAEECDPNSTDYKNGSNSRFLVNGASVSNVNKQYLCGSTGSWAGSPNDVKKYDINGNVVSGFVFNASAKNNSSCMTFGGYCGDGVVQYDHSITKTESEQDQKNFLYSNPNGSLEQCDPKNRLVYLRNSSYTNQYDCGDPLGVDACKNKGGYCGDGIKNGGEECDYSAGGSNDYDSTNLVKNLSSLITQNSSVSKQYKCGKPQALSLMPGLKSKYNSSGNPIVSFTDSDFASENNVSSCVTYGGFCGDGKIQTTYNVEVSRSNQEWFRTNGGSLEQCDPNGHSVVAKYSSNTNSYSCGSVDSNRACYNLSDIEKDSSGKYGGYCGDGKIQYDLTKPADVNGGIYDTSNINISLSKPEQCDPNGHSVSPKQSSTNNQYSCGASGDDNACLDIGGWCGDGILQSGKETCDIGSNLSDVSDGVNQFCGSCIKFDCSNGANIAGSTVYLVRGSSLVNIYTGSYAIMNALSAAINNDVVFVGLGNFEFNDDYSIDLSNKNVILNSCVSTVWSLK